MTMYIANPLYLPHTGLSIRSLSHFALLCRRFTLDELDGKEISKWQFIMHIDTCIISHMQFILALIKTVSCFIQACISFTMIINGWVYMFACAQFACQCLISKTELNSESMRRYCFSGLVSDLQFRLSSWHGQQCLGDVFVKFTLKLKAYTNFLRVYPLVLTTIEKCVEQGPLFRAFLKRHERTAASKMLT